MTQLTWGQETAMQPAPSLLWSPGVPWYWLVFMWEGNDKSKHSSCCWESQWNPFTHKQFLQHTLLTSHLQTAVLFVFSV